MSYETPRLACTSAESDGKNAISGWWFTLPVWLVYPAFFWKCVGIGFVALMLYIVLKNPKEICSMIYNNFHDPHKKKGGLR